MLTVLIQAAIAIVQLPLFYQVRLRVSITLSRSGVVVSDKAVACRGRLPPVCHSILFKPWNGWCTVPFGPLGVPRDMEICSTLASGCHLSTEL